jgi:hypothetical protein
LWLTPIILATQEAEIWRIMIQSQSRQIVLVTLSQKIKGWRVAQSVDPEFKPQCYKKKKQRKILASLPPFCIYSFALNLSLVIAVGSRKDGADQ